MVNLVLVECSSIHLKYVGVSILREGVGHLMISWSVEGPNVSSLGNNHLLCGT